MDPNVEMWKKKKSTCGVNPVQENLNEMCVDRLLPRDCHLFLNAAQNLHTGFGQ